MFLSLIKRDADNPAPGPWPVQNSNVRSSCQYFYGKLNLNKNHDGIQEQQSKMSSSLNMKNFFGLVFLLLLGVKNLVALCTYLLPAINILQQAMCVPAALNNDTIY